MNQPLHPAHLTPPSRTPADLASADLTLAHLRAGYRAGHFAPRDIIGSLLDQVDAGAEQHVWITRLSRAQVMVHVDALDPAAIDRLPLYGIPFVIKDNIDLAGVPTTAGCPEYAYTPERSATVVERLVAAGAIPLGKTNLDQFATGLVGTRSPYGACRNSIDREFISGGSSSGSAVAVAGGMASFSLGTDTAGSGRVPAAFNNLIGLKPSNGRLSTCGVVPACRSLDCVSIFTLTAADAAEVLAVAEGFDAADPYSRAVAERSVAARRFGVPRADQLQFFGDHDYRRLFGASVAHLEGLGLRKVEIDFEPFLAAARLLYEGPWVAERYAAVGGFIEAHPDAVHPVTRAIIEGGRQPSGVAVFQGQYRLREYQRRTEAAWADVDLLVTPTAGTIYRIEEVLVDPVGLNANLGRYTNFVNFLDLCGVAVPTGFRADGLPFGITLVGRSGMDRALLELASRLHYGAVARLGATTLPVPAPTAPVGTARAGTAAVGTAPVGTALRPGYLALAVCGAHMQGLPLNHQLGDRGGYLLQAARTAPHYRLVALPGGPPYRPGLLRVPEPARGNAMESGAAAGALGGAAIELEVWALPNDQVGAFIAGIGAPLGIGKVELASGELVSGFICEGYAAAGATDITGHGGWRGYLDATAGLGYHTPS